MSDDGEVIPLHGDSEFTRVDEYSFRGPFIPNEDDIARAQAHINGDLRFLGLDEEEQQQRTVVKLAINSVGTRDLELLPNEGDERSEVIDLFGKAIIRVISTNVAGQIEERIELVTNNPDSGLLK